MHPPTEEERQVIAKELSDSKRVATLSRYFNFYTSVTCPSTSEALSIQVDNPAFKTHADILDCVDRLRLEPKLTREQFMNVSLPDEGVSSRDKEDATRTVVRVRFMLDCSLKDNYSKGFELGGYVPAKWELTEPFDSFVQRAIPRSFNNAPRGVKEYKKDLKAWKLKKRHRLKFRPTDNIMEHLLYDPGARIVKIFHHTSYLKAQLARSINEPIELDTHSSLKLGTLPPQLLLETLDSFQFILFPISLDGSGKSHRLLRRLISKYDFDPNSRWDEGHVRPLPEQFSYEYWGARLEKLHAIVKNPPPANRVVSWFERHSSERNALTVAIIGLLLGAIFGFLGFLVGLAQLWVAVIAWKSPRSPM